MSEVDRLYRLGLTKFDELCGKYEYPSIIGTNLIPDKLIGFNYVLSNRSAENNKNKAVHFFLDDYQFERVWNRPETYVPMFEKYKAILTPDFSLYKELPIAMQIWNVFRSRCIGHLAERIGIPTIITLQWSTPSSFSFCFDGLPKGKTVAVSTNGIVRDNKARELFLEGMEVAIQRLEPSAILLHGVPIKFNSHGIPVYKYENENSRKFNDSRKE